MHITITGNLGSGKSTVCSYLHSKYDFQVFSTGNIHREIARKMNKSTLETNWLMEKDFSYDYLIDDEVVRISKEQKLDDIVFDSRMAWHFVEKAFNVFLLVNVNVAANRVFADSRGNEEVYSTIDETKKQLIARSKAERERFSLIYNVDYLDLSKYDVVIDTSFCSQEVIAELIYSEAKQFYESSSYTPKILLSIRNLYPTQPIRNINPTVLEQHKEKYSQCRVYMDSLISVARYQDMFFIIDGHHRAIACAKASIPLITVKIIASEAEDVVTTSISLEDYLSSAKSSFLYDYEEICKFRYLEYPKLIV